MRGDRDQQLVISGQLLVGCHENVCAFDVRTIKQFLIGQPQSL
jgi:hypothetical protein